MGEGPMWDPDEPGGVIGQAAEIMKRKGLTPIKLKAKEGLAAVNGTQMMSSLGAEACTRAANVRSAPDVAVSMSLEGPQRHGEGVSPSYSCNTPSCRAVPCCVASEGNVAARGNPSEIYRNHRVLW